MNNNVIVKVETIEDFEKDIINKKEQVSILFEKMITETENIKPFFNTKAGNLINSSLLDILNTKKENILNINDEFINNLKSAEGLYTAAIENIKKGVEG